jgi:hypothetical protein
MCKEEEEKNKGKLENNVPTPFKIGIIEGNKPMEIDLALVILIRNNDGSSTITLDRGNKFDKIEVRGFLYGGMFKGKNTTHELIYDYTIGLLFINSTNGNFSLQGKNQNSITTDDCSGLCNPGL